MSSYGAFLEIDSNSPSGIGPARKCAALAAVSLIVLLAVACGGSKAGPSDGPTTSGDKQDEIAAASPPENGPMARLAYSMGVGAGSLSTGQAATAPVAPAKPEVVQLPSGTPIRVRTTSTLSTRSAESGQEFVATLVEPLMADGEMIAPRGADVVGRVVTADPGGRVKGVASISVSLARLRLANGDEVTLDTSRVSRTARTTRKRDATKVGVGSGAGALIGAIAGGGKGAAIGAAAGAGAGTGVVLATRGEPAVLPAESLLTFTTRSPLEVRF